MPSCANPIPTSGPALASPQKRLLNRTGEEEDRRSLDQPKRTACQLRCWTSLHDMTETPLKDRDAGSCNLPASCWSSRAAGLSRAGETTDQTPRLSLSQHEIVGSSSSDVVPPHSHCAAHRPEQAGNNVILRSITCRDQCQGARSLLAREPQLSRRWMPTSRPAANSQPAAACI